MEWYSVAFRGGEHAYVEASSKQQAEVTAEETVGRDVHSSKLLVFPELIELIEQRPETIESNQIHVIPQQVHLGDFR